MWVLWAYRPMAHSDEAEWVKINDGEVTAHEALRRHFDSYSSDFKRRATFHCFLTGFGGEVEYRRLDGAEVWLEKKG